MATKKQYDAKFKAKLALELLKEQKSMIELSAEYKVPHRLIYIAGRISLLNLL